MPGPPTKLPEGKKIAIAERYTCGESMKTLAREFEVCVASIAKYCRKEKRKKEPFPLQHRNTPSTLFKKFAQSVRMILWRENKVRKLLLEQWEARKLELKEGGLTDKQAIVMASKDFHCLHPLFLQYPVNEFDPNPDSHPHIHMHGEEIKLDGIECDEHELTHAENFQWAMNAAGIYFRMKEPPKKCPNNSAYFLYRQAIDDGNTFMAKYQQMMLDKAKNPNPGDESIKRGARQSIEEISSMLDTLGEET
ncbi:hypothetical protein LCGC14_1255620 [marine sediment metagenome]|uniref:HTH psq-type domain-containing protein n=1 Tax=marine sediment metagenome TaxID=412755 RepID=A0A0F9L249_9ZZZZ